MPFYRDNTQWSAVAYLDCFFLVEHTADKAGKKSNLSDINGYTKCIN